MRIPGRPPRAPKSKLRRSDRVSAVAVSIGFHLTALGIFAFVEQSAAQPVIVETVDTEWDAGDATIVDHVLAQPLNPVKDAPPAPALAAFAAPMSADLSIAPPRSGALGGGIAGPATGASDNKERKPGGGGGKGKFAGKGGEGAGVGDGDGGGGGFFGLSAEGDKFVYVVDCSRSMGHPYPGRARTRLARVQLELLDSVRHLKSNQEFFIIFFNHNAYPMPANALVKATDESKVTYLKWMSKAVPDGSTDPSVALSLALKLRPDVVYFLTDGDFNGHIVKALSLANKGRQTHIHTIGFGDNRGENLLKLIAEQNQGRYQFISADEESEDSDQAATDVAAPR